MRRSPLSQAITAIPYDVIASFMGRPTLLDKDQVKSAPYVVAMRDGHLIGAAGNEVYAHGIQSAALDERYSIVHVEEQLIDPESRDLLGYSGIYVGSGPVARTGDPAKVVLTESTREALQGDKVFPESVDVNVDFVPHAPSADVQARVIAVRSHTVMGQYQVIALNRGTGAGLEPGHVLAIEQAGSAVRDTYSKGGLGAGRSATFAMCSTAIGRLRFGEQGDEQSVVTEPTRTSGPDPLLDEPLDWVVRLKAGAPTRADVDALQRWRAQSPDHEDAFRAAARLLRSASAAAKELADEQAATASVVVLPPRPSRLLTRRIVLGGAIAAAAGYVMIRPPLDMWPSIEELSADYRTGKGEQRKVMLAPDISVELNTQTSLALRPTPNETRVELISGEASAIARRTSSTPLVMLARDGRISALQADFNARCLDGVVSVTCLDGIVTVEQDGRSVQLRKAEQVTYSPAGLQASLPVDARQVAAWQTGLLIFRDRPLASVVDEVNRYRAGKIIITNAELKRRLVNGTFQVDKLDNFVAQVEQLFGRADHVVAWRRGADELTWSVFARSLSRT